MNTIQSPLSQGAIMLIERMQTNPEEFRPDGKFHRIISDATFARSVWTGASVFTHVPLMGLADADAFIRAFQAYILADEFTEMVVKSLVAGKEWDEDGRKRLSMLGNFGAGGQAQSIMGSRSLMGMLTEGQQP